jgi:hypothetical protein
MSPSNPPQPKLKLYSRSSLFYWWPIWVVGYVLMLVTWLGAVSVPLTTEATPPNEVKTVLIHPSATPGIVFVAVFFLVLLLTNVAVRGVWSVVVLLTIVFLIVLMSSWGLWEPIFKILPELRIYANPGFYLVISTLVFGVWLWTVLVSDRLNYWQVTPGQVTHQHVVGGGEKSYDTDGMVVEQLQDDLFRHWILGFGSGDLRISTTGARREEFSLPNILFVNSKVEQMQRLIAMKPDQDAPTSA